jgi:hypothetical protein
MEALMRTKVQKRRDSLALLGQGSPVPAQPRRQYTLEELVRDVTPENCHEESDFGPPVGREIL